LLGRSHADFTISNFTSSKVRQNPYRVIKISAIVTQLIGSNWNIVGSISPVCNRVTMTRNSFGQLVSKRDRGATSTMLYHDSGSPVGTIDPRRQPSTLPCKNPEIVTHFIVPAAAASTPPMIWAG
jgi:YD repeat-containing protein